MKTRKVCEALDHQSNPGRIVKDGGICVECGGFVPDEPIVATERNEKPKVEHSPTPQLQYDIERLGDPDILAASLGISVDEAEYIVRAVNSFHSLVATLQIALEQGEFQPRVRKIIEDEIAKAEKGE